MCSNSNKNLGIFNTDGEMYEDEFYTRKEAMEAIADRYSDEDDLEIHLVCSEHPEQIAEFCEFCNCEDDEESDVDSGDEESDEDDE